jgi:hypothetical protein
MSDIPRTIRCEMCEGDGYEMVHRPDFYDPCYMHKTRNPCPACDGDGYIEIEDESVEMEDFDEEEHL